MRKAIAVGFSVLVLVAFPLSARSDTGKAVALGAGLGTAMMITCVASGALVYTDADEDGFARGGWLVGVAGSYAIETFEDVAQSDIQSFLGPTASLSVDNSLGVNGRVGYRCNRRFSTEVEVEWLNGFEADFSEASLGSGTLDVEPLVVTANAKAYLLTGRYQPFLLVGGGPMIAKLKARASGGSANGTETETETEFAFRFGGGIDLYATKHVVVNVGVDYVLPFDDLKDVDYISIGWGFEYRF